MRFNYQYNTGFLQKEAALKDEENQHFSDFLKLQNTLLVDETVHRLNEEVSNNIDCTLCGNCCRSLMINVEPRETQVLAQKLNMPVEGFKAKYLEESQQGALVINTIPCHFLSDNKCSIYEDRFIECRQFPHLHKPFFVKRLFGTLMHYGRCPIVYNVIELLKIESGFLSRN